MALLSGRRRCLLFRVIWRAFGRRVVSCVKLWGRRCWQPKMRWEEVEELRVVRRVLGVELVVAEAA